MANENIVQAYRQSPWRIQLQVVGLFLLLLVMIALVAGIYLNVTARAATIGRRIQEMQFEIQVNQRLNADLAIIDKRRSAPNQAKAMAVIGDVTGKIVVILDDMADTAGTLTEAVEAVRSLPISEDFIRKTLGENAARLLSL